MFKGLFGRLKLHQIVCEKPTVKIMRLLTVHLCRLNCNCLSNSFRQWQ